MKSVPYLSSALAYFSRSLFAMSDIYGCGALVQNRMEYVQHTNLDLDQLVLVPLINVLELCQIILLRFHLVLERAQLSSDMSVLGTACS